MVHRCHILTHAWELVPGIASPCLAFFLPLTSSPVHPFILSAPDGFVFPLRASPKYFKFLFLTLNEQYGSFNSYLPYLCSMSYPLMG